MKAFRHLAPAFLLALALLLGQRAAQLHDLSHAIESVQHGSRDQHPGSDTCDKCLQYAPFSGAAAASLVAAPVILATAIVAALASYLPALSRTVVHSRSRAPPASV